MHYGNIKKLEINIPWKKNFSIPTEIIIENGTILCSTLNQSNWEYLTELTFQIKSQRIINFISDKVNQLSSVLDNKEEGETNYIDKILIKVLDNLYVKFKNINFRIEDTNSPSNVNSSLGLSFDEMMVTNTNSKWEIEFIDRSKTPVMNCYKIMKIISFGLYCKYNDKHLLTQSVDEDMHSKVNEFGNGKDKYICIEDYIIKPSKASYS